MYYVKDDHEAIIPRTIWKCVQLESERRKKYLEEHGQTHIRTDLKAIHLHQGYFAEVAIRYLHVKAGEAAQVLTERYENAVSGTRSKGLWDVVSVMWKKKR